MIAVYWTEKFSVLGDIIRCYSSRGSCIVFTETKKEANDIILSGCIKEGFLKQNFFVQLFLLID